MASRKNQSENSLLPLAERILKDQGQSVTDWKQGVIQARKLEVLSGKDKAWEEMVLEQAAIQIVKDGYSHGDTEKKTALKPSIHEKGGADNETSTFNSGTGSV